MSDIRRTHRGYFGVALGLAVSWYIGLGIAFSLSSGTLSVRSQTYHLISAYIPLSAWGIIYLVLGTVMLVSVLVPRVPHIVVRGCCLFGLMLTAFWLSLYYYALAIGKMDLISVIPAWTTIAAVEWAAFREPVGGTRRR